MQFATPKSFLKTNYKKSCIVPDIAYLLIIFLCVSSVNAKCLLCEQNYFKCRSNVIDVVSSESMNPADLLNSQTNVQSSIQEINNDLNKEFNKEIPNEIHKDLNKDLPKEKIEKKEKNTKQVLECNCLEELLKCHEEHKCSLKQEIKRDYDGLHCTFRIPKTIQEVDRVSISPVMLLSIFLISFFVISIICIVLLAIRYRKEITQKFQRIGKKDIILCNGKDDCFDEEKQLLGNEKEEERKMCKICYENKKNSVFIPCGHICSCFECALKLEECPLCRMKIEKIVKTFDA